MKKLLIVLLILLLPFILVPSMDSANEVVETTYFTQPISTTEFSEPETEPPTTLDRSLHMDPGSYLLKYEDEITGDYLEYYLFIPENAEINMPLVVFLHGDGEVGKPKKLENYAMIKQARLLYGEEFPFIAISPCTRTTSWTKGSIPLTLKSLIDYTVSDLSIDENRISITGHSRGAIGVWHMISTYGDYFSSAVIVSSIYSGELNIENCAKVPIQAFAGSEGDLEKQCQRPTRRLIDQISQISDQASYTLLKGCDHGKTKDAAFSQDTFDWILAQRKE